MKKTTFSLSLSVAKRNKGFTLGLIGLFTILTTIILMARFTVPSVRKTIDDYMAEYRVPDIWALTEPLPARAGELLPAAPEIIGHEYGLVTDVRCRVDGKQVFALSLVSIEGEGFLKYSLIDEQHTDRGIPEVMISSYYATANDIQPGEIVELKTGKGYQDFFVSALVYCPVNMFCIRDSTSWCDSADFGYLYISRDVMDEYFPSAGITNFWAFRLAEDCSDAREEEIFQQISDTFGTQLLSSDRFSSSNIIRQLDDEMDQAKTIIGFAPLLSYALGIFFTCLFIQQVMQDQKKTIGLLRALGYSCNQVLNVFVLYTVLACLIGMILGIGLGAYLTQFCIGIYQERYSLPYIHYSTDIPSLILFLLLPMAIGIISCITRSGIISKMDPAEAYGGAAPAECADPPRWLQRLRLSEMVKIAVVSVYRNKRRFLLSAVSIACSIVLSLWSIATIVSNNAAQPAAFGDGKGNGGRFQYDALVSFSGGTDYPEQVRKEEGVSLAEPLIVFMAELRSESNTLELQINALSEGSTLIAPADADGSPLQPGDGILLEEVAAKQLGVKVGAVMELIPRITALFIEGLKPITQAVNDLLAKRFSNSNTQTLKPSNTSLFSIGMSPALVIGHPTTLVVSILLIPVILFLSVALPGNKFLPLASLAGMFYLFPCVLPITKGNVLKTFIVGLVALVCGLYFVTNLTPAFTKAIVAAKCDGISVPAGFEGGAALDFASAFWCWSIYHLTVTLKTVGAVGAGALALGLTAVNFIRIRRAK